jgi:hypothetical protein
MSSIEIVFVIVIDAYVVVFSSFLLRFAYHLTRYGRDLNWKDGPIDYAHSVQKVVHSDLDLVFLNILRVDVLLFKISSL